MKRRIVCLSLVLSVLTGVFPLHAADESKPQLLSTTGGKGGGWDSLEALQKAADSGNPAACYELGEMHLAGQQVPQDAKKAVALLERAADAGHANAAFRLGKLHADGEVVPKNLPQAFARYQSAAAAGVAEAQYNLGAMYASGRGVKRDYVEGLAWLIVAAKNGADAEGEKQLRGHLTQMKRIADIASAEKRAAAILGKSADAAQPATKPASNAGGSAANGAPAAVRPDGKVKLGEAPPPASVPLAPVSPGGLSLTPMAPPPAPPPPPKADGETGAPDKATK